VSTANPTTATALAPWRRSLTGARPSWWSQAAVIGIGLWLYDAINNLSPLRTATAMANARGILHLERILHLDPELAANQWLSEHPSLGRVLGSWYDLAHFSITLGLLAWVFLRHAHPYRFLRNALIGTNAIGFLVFWMWPLAPPRLVPGSGYVDIVAITNAIGVKTAGTGSPHANELAAMPSLHIAYAVWCVLAVWMLCEHWLPRALVAGHLVVTTGVVLATGNHYTLDVIAGVVTAAVAAAGAALVTRRQAHVPTDVAHASAFTT
jgi:hypothetical protein